MRSSVCPPQSLWRFNHLQLRFFGEAVPLGSSRNEQACSNFL